METISRSTLGELRPGDPVNLERPMQADGRFDGHIVQGHVDGVGVIVAVEPEGQGKRIRVRVPVALSRYVIEKGSITVDGVSLTVAAVEGDEVEIALIPHSLQVTTLGLRAVGEKVNLEVDVLAKYVEKLLKA
jgi:riboflavin synthase